MSTPEAKKVHHMKLTTGGRMSVPAEVRRRWDTNQVKITDEGGRIVMEPEPRLSDEGGEA